MPAPDAAAAGPLDDRAVGPARTQILLRGGCLLLLFAAVLGVGIALAPDIAAGLGLAGRVQARVVSVTGLPAGPGEPDGSGRTCEKDRIVVTWGDHRSGTAEPCRPAGAAAPAVGDVVTIRAVPGWDRVAVGPVGPDSALAAVVIVLLLASGGAAAVQLRQLRALVAARGRPVTVPGLPARKDRMRVVHRRQTMIRLRFDDAPHRPLRVLVPESVEQSRAWTGARVHPLRRTIRGRPAGPYVLRPAGGGAPIVGLGRALRPREASREASRNASPDASPEAPPEASPNASPTTSRETG